MPNSFQENLSKLLENIEIKIDEKKANLFYKYMELLLEWNEKINLTAITNEGDIILKHFVDSLTVLKFLNKNDKCVDIGTGAGFPGIPIAIVNEEMKVYLVDSLNKRINFLNDVKEKINLKNAYPLHFRAEEFGQNKEYRESFDVAVSRAVANLSTLAEYLIPLVKVGGKVICMKGSNIEEELKMAQNAINELGGKIINKVEFVLPNTDMKRSIIIIEKIKSTPKKYPRRAGIPAKQPIS